MGNDGGSIPKRRELVKEAARIATTSEVKETQNEQQEYHWTTCPLSHQPLRPPIVSDASGKLYNKDAILEFLLPDGDGTPGTSKSDNEEVLKGRVRSLRDVIEVKFQVEELSRPQENGKTASITPRWLCPITNKPLGPGVKAVYLVPCGHAFSESAVKEMAAEKCLQCDESYAADNVISILPTTDTDRARLASRIERLKEQGLTHSLKKAPGSTKKRKKNVDTSAEETSVPQISEAINNISKSALHPQTHSGTTTPGGGIKNAATASLTAKVLAEEQEKAKRRKLGSNDNLKSLFSTGKTARKDGDFMTRGFSIPTMAKR